MLAWKNRNIPTAYSSWRETVQQVTMQMNGKHSQERQNTDVNFWQGYFSENNKQEDQEREQKIKYVF